MKYWGDGGERREWLDDDGGGGNGQIIPPPFFLICDFEIRHFKFYDYLRTLNLLIN